MSSIVQRLNARELIRPPRWLPENVQYETIMGSVAYGVSSNTSDVDVLGWAIPPREEVFPHLAGHIAGFGKPPASFGQYQEHHVTDPTDARGKGRRFDLAIFGVVKYFQLAMECNPNVLDSLFTPVNCVVHATRVGQLVRENRRLFLHKGCWPRYKGYAYSQLHKMGSKKPEGKRKQIRDRYGYDVKFAYHVVRLLGECEQILMEGDLDLQRNHEHLKAIRRGEVPEADVRLWAADKEKQLERLYSTSSIPAGPPVEKIKSVLLQCLEQHYGKLADAVLQPEAAIAALREVQAVLDRNRQVF